MATITLTGEAVSKAGVGSFTVGRSSLPPKLPPDFLSNYPKLSKEQAGHLRHFHNLVTQPDGEWHHMGAQDPGQEWADAYRYQLATMAYAAGAAHYHRLPALRSVFKTLLEQLIHKMLRREVWGYWYLTSQGGKIVDPDLVELRKPWADPNKQENIMYSGHLLLMVSLHAMLFNDDKYDEPEALTFVWDPIFWGFGPEKFTYSRSSLQQAILAEMERENWKGVCCEPNCIFIVCNQFPIIAMRYNDFRKGTNVAEEVLQKYLAAWGGENSLVQEDKFFFNWYMVKQGRTVPGGLAVSAWTSAFMNGWNSQFVHSLFPAQSLGFLSYAPDGRINLNDEKVAKSIRELAESETIDPYAWSTKRRAHDRLGQTGEAQPAEPLSQPMFGYVAQWVSEVGDAATCDGLLLHADRFLNPCWERGGLFYPRSSELTDKDGNWKYMDPYSGNAGIAYARLNVTDGQKKMWDTPWSSEHFSGYPFLDGLSLSSDVDFLRGAWDQLTEAMVVTMRTWDASQKTIRVLVRNLPVGHYGVYKNEILSGTLDVADSSDPVHVTVEVGAEETDLVLLKCK